MQTSTNDAIQILKHLHEHRGNLQTAWMIAQSIGITYPLFARLATRLRKAGLVTSAPGRNGGYVLGKPAHEISFYDVLSAIEGERPISASLGDGQHRVEGNDCKVHAFLQAVQDHVIAEMSDKYIADFV